jgi:hypothetical protein
MDKISPIIAAWKISDEVECTNGGNPNIKWAMTAWNSSK